MKNGGYGSAREPIIKLLKQRPGLQAKEIAADLGKSLSATQRCLKTAEARGLVHYEAAYNFLGPPLRRWYAGKAAKCAEVCPVLLRLEQLGPSTVAELAHELGWPVTRVSGRLRRARGTKTRIDSWKTEKVVVGVWSLGNEPDAKRQRAMTDQERAKRYYQNNKSLCYVRRRRSKTLSKPSRLWMQPIAKGI